MKVCFRGGYASDETTPWSLTAGREYEVLGRESDCFRIIDDTDEPYLFMQDHFDVVDAAEPDFWVSSFGTDGERYSYPAEWAQPGFFEAYFDGVPRARDTFLRVLQERWR